jgi:hypothetical protein
VLLGQDLQTREELGVLRQQEGRHHVANGAEYHCRGKSLQVCPGLQELNIGLENVHLESCRGIHKVPI